MNCVGSMERLETWKLLFADTNTWKTKHTATLGIGCALGL